MSDMDRHTTASIGAFQVIKVNVNNILERISSKIFPFQPNGGSDYLENNCLRFNVDRYSSGEDPRSMGEDTDLSCQFKAHRGKLMKTVDSVYQNVHSRDECQQRCINANFRYFNEKTFEFQRSVQKWL